MRTVILYLLLVGLPLAGVITILTNGSRLVPPTSVGGKWLITKQGTDDGSFCQRLVVATNDPKLSISQSGRLIDMQFNDTQNTSFKGFLQGSHISAQTVRPVNPTEKNVSCRGTNKLAMEADITKEGGKVSLAGSIKVDGCDNCVPVAFTATLSPTKK